MRKITLFIASLFMTIAAMAQTPVVELSQIGTAPYLLSDADATKIFDMQNLTVAMEVTTGTMSGRGAFFCVADPDQPVPENFSGTNTSFMACGHVGQAPAYIAAAKDGQHFSTSSIPNNTESVKLVYVFDKTNNKFKIYVNGSEVMNRNFNNYEIATPKMVKEDYPNAKIYIGGGMASNAAHELCDATINMVKVYNAVLTSEQIAEIFPVTLPANAVKTPADLVSGKVYTFETQRGWLMATAGVDYVYNSNKLTNSNPSKDNKNCQWIYYSTEDGNYLYNVGVGKFMSYNSADKNTVPLSTKPTTSALEFKSSTLATHPIIIGIEKHAVNHNTSASQYTYGVLLWDTGWTQDSQAGDMGSSNLVFEVGDAAADVLADIKNLVAGFETKLYYKIEVEGLTNKNPNTHFGGITLASNNVVATTDDVNKTAYVLADLSGNITLSSSYEYRGFDFVGFYLDGVALGKNPTLTAEQKEKLVAGTPVVAKFKTDGTGDVTLFYNDDPKSYRIPAIATTSTGRIVAISDYRHNLDDIGRDNHGTGTKRIDLVIRTSDDNGATWSEIKTIAAGDNSKEGSYERAFGDAAVAAVGENVVVMAAAGDVLFPNGSTSNPNRMARVFSSDNGVTWTIEEMTTKMYSTATSLIPSGGSAFFGSGKLAVDHDYNGTGNARIYGALLVRIGTNNYNNFAIYSDDLGKNWNILGGSQTPVAAGDEPKVEILPNGQILLSARRVGGRVFNIFTYTNKETSAGTWNSAVNGCNNGGNNGTNGEIMCVDAKNSNGDAVKLLLQSQPKGGSGQYDRKNVTIWYKEVSANATYTSNDMAGNWIEGKQVSSVLSSYSTMSLQQNGDIAFFFEEEPCYAGDYTKGYSMVYVPLTIEDITNENYFSTHKKEDDNTTAVENFEVEDSEEHIFDLAGRKVSEITASGIYIVGGKKVIK